ncbi:hypothetical protein [Andreprevotia chitinilytica]|uniref:hypothetical protein n=1 Tax=Andreprevotia chitinilytica TaxID=396808 RepID=UPI0005527096|nr:hypothetical protein [Andreprevotia chitinilytica]
MNICISNLHVPIDDIALVPSARLAMCQTPESVTGDVHWMAIENGNVYLNHAGGIAKFLVSGGRQIDFEIAPDISEQDLQCMLMSAPMGALIHQRGELPIHGAGLVSPKNDGVTVIVGNCGAGKSTTSAALANQGWHLIADDICRISPSPQQDETGELVVHRGYTRIKLTDDACGRLGFDSSILPRVSSFVDKYFWEAPHIGGPEYAPKRLILLHRPSGTAALEWGRCVGEVAIRALMPHIYAPNIGSTINAQNSMFLLSRLVQIASVYVLFIPAGVGPKEVADEITRFIHEDE